MENTTTNWVFKAIVSLAPGAHFTMSGADYASVIWYDPVITKPLESDVVAEVTRLKNQFLSNQYQRDRQNQYPNLLDFIDAYYWEKKGNSELMDAYIAQCDEVKNKYPKF